MGVPADQLLADALGDFGESSGVAFLHQQREEVDLEENVTQLVAELGIVSAGCGVGELISLLDRVRNDRALVLLAIPWAFDAQDASQLVEERQRPAGFAGAIARCVGRFDQGVGVGAACCGTACWGTEPCGTEPCGTDPCGTEPCGTDPCGTEPCGTVPCGTVVPPGSSDGSPVALWVVGDSTPCGPCGAPVAGAPDPITPAKPGATGRVEGTTASPQSSGLATW